MSSNKALKISFALIALVGAVFFLVPPPIKGYWRVTSPVDYRLSNIQPVTFVCQFKDGAMILKQVNRPNGSVDNYNRKEGSYARVSWSSYEITPVDVQDKLTIRVGWISGVMKYPGVYDLPMRRILF